MSLCDGCTAKNELHVAQSVVKHWIFNLQVLAAFCNQ